MTAETARVSVLLVDNYDSFVFNLADEFARRGHEVVVWRNDISATRALELAAALPAPRLLVLSPGPGTPERAGCCEELVRRAPVGIPLFGVCLGHQAIVQALGGRVGQARRVVHGKASRVDHARSGLFEGLPSPMAVGRYHSLVGTRIPEELVVTAELDGEPMAVEHSQRPIYGVQFHPESILTPLGGRLIDNLIRLAARGRDEKWR
ncbi:MAG: aminodeoxychorismate/anthranilate synthase component II [Deltaproteobacteria bacterium]|nr:aminodeoxychorismate/anthranilate synthase component II [Deltaproteobacteria bacterium]